MAITKHFFKIVRLEHSSWDEDFKKTRKDRDSLSNHLKYILENLEKDGEETLYLKCEKYCDSSLINSDKHRINIGKYMVISDRLYKDYKEDSDTFFDYDDLISRGEIKIFSKSELEQYLENLKKEIDQNDTLLKAVYQSYIGC